jgi:hypothetical protein
MVDPGRWSHHPGTLDSRDPADDFGGLDVCVGPDDAGQDILDMLGFIGDLGAGGLYIVSRALDQGSGAIFRATADYGTKFMIVAGLLNVIAAVDAHHIALGKKR